MLEVPSPQAQAQNPAGNGGGWIAWADWIDAGASMITYFSTVWIVPAAPSTQSGQLIYLFNALEDGPGNDILQPVLQWGLSGAGGGNYWAVASWYVDSSNHAFCTAATQLNVGDRLTGLITLAIQADGSLNYTSQLSAPAFTRYVDLKRALGRRFDVPSRTLQSLDRFLHDHRAKYPDLTALQQIGGGARFGSWSFNNA